MMMGRSQSVLFVQWFVSEPLEIYIYIGDDVESQNFIYRSNGKIWEFSAILAKMDVE